MPILPEEIYRYYSTQGIVSDPKEYANLFDNLPSDIASICKVIQGVMIHAHWVERYGPKLPKERWQGEINLRAVYRQLARIREMDDRPLTVARTHETKLIGTCRDYATFMASILRYQGIPARARCGFGIYFMPNHYEDHWICEYWNAGQNRWVMVDPQLDDFQKEKLGIQFDSTDMTPGMFVTGGQAWQKCRAGSADPEQFGIFDYHGLDFIAANLVRDILSLNKIEILPWDNWPLIKSFKDFTPEHVSLLDNLAELTISPDKSFTDIRTAYEIIPGLRAAEGWEG